MWLFGRKGPSGFSSSSTAEEVTQGIDGTGLSAIVTGASSGIGAETARVLALRGVHVVMAVRNISNGNAVKEVIVKEIPSAKIDVMELDLSSMVSVRKFASEFDASNIPLNILINNAGVMATPFSLSQDGWELQFATNHIGHFLLTNLLLEKMKSTSGSSGIEGRIVILSSEGHKLTYSDGIRFNKINNQAEYQSYLAYGQSKLANILHANELARRLKEEGANITVNSLHPGVIMTNLFRYQNYFVNAAFGTIARFATKTVPQGAATTCYVAMNPEVKGVTGKYFNNSNICTPNSKALDQKLAQKLWDFSMNIIQA
ncbi:NAD(P)-binding Rossmann-fold superfamily protein [Rhynchospora pubera]|uniref:NAD(P)-binding Rossmann-fold superfamily protein n=1 Tax=Rhynchospora pubera TaxID=906938 RepID=A0AAV8EHP7_9POAL|nr:NAD(P)-binding Rossmann-fold superfamily protein [Rhynchospora pubera]